MQPDDVKVEFRAPTPTDCAEGLSLWRALRCVHAASGAFAFARSRGRSSRRKPVSGRLVSSPNGCRLSAAVGLLLTLGGAAALASGAPE